MQDNLFTLIELSKYLKIPKSTLYKLSQRGKIPSVKIGKQLRFRQSSLDKWFAVKENRSIYTPVPKPLPKPKNILLIDDDPLVLKTVGRLLQSHGYKIEQAASGEEAIEKAQNSRFDLIISDIRMPGINGIETLKRIRDLNANANRPAIPEIIITGYIDTQAQQEAANLGISDYLYKPFSIDEFMHAVSKN